MNHHVVGALTATYEELMPLTFNGASLPKCEQILDMLKRETILRWDHSSHDAKSDQGRKVEGPMAPSPLPAPRLPSAVLQL